MEAVSKIADGVQGQGVPRIESGAYTSWLEATPTNFLAIIMFHRLISNINSGSGILPR
jgi:hypothetical protein